jgi:hypothetical protein
VLLKNTVQDGPWEQVREFSLSAMNVLEVFPPARPQERFRIYWRQQALKVTGRHI